MAENIFGLILISVCFIFSLRYAYLVWFQPTQFLSKMKRNRQWVYKTVNSMPSYLRIFLSPYTTIYKLFDQHSSIDILWERIAIIIIIIMIGIGGVLFLRSRIFPFP